MLHFRDVLVTPYTDLIGPKYHRGGPHWPDWDKQVAARHCRQRGKPVDIEPEKRSPTTTLPGPLAWGGGICWHYGHQIADFSARLLPTLDELPDARFAFSMRDDAVPFRSWETTPDYFREILDWYGISEDRIELIAEPTTVERLVVAPQAEIHYEPHAEQPRDAGPESWYLDLLDKHTYSRLGDIERSGALYVSRAAQIARFAGEAYLEQALAKAGFQVLRAETVSIEEKLRAYAGAESILLAEGSGIYTAQLMGRALGDVTVLVRRPGGGQVVEPVLKPRSRSFRCLELLHGIVYGLTVAGGRGFFRGISILDSERLVGELRLGDVWDQGAFERARDADVTEWLEQERASERWQVPGSPELVMENLEAAGLSHLA
jgi:hypothetical protein